ncbi:MAG: type II secretion system GspH family protein [Burkholderiales bacterium]|nr:type II secretion system GspH family protein [Burkholderiales bacterium]
MKNLSKSFKRGFTLIELLVVVAIIAILVAVIMASTTESRNRGADAGIKTNLNTIKGAAELFYVNPLTVAPTKPAFSFGSDISGNCPSYSASSNVMFQRDKNIADAIAEATKRSSVNYAFCDANATNWAVGVVLKTDAKSAWCVDSSNASKKVTRVANGAMVISDVIDTATHLCK